MLWKICGHDFIRDFDVLNGLDRWSLKNDIDQEIENNNVATTVPPIQTNNHIFEKNSHKIYWNNLNKFFIDTINKHYRKDVKLQASWANKSDESNCYGMHNHENIDLTCVYYLKSNKFEYGTNINDQIIIPFIENSSMIFDGKINHSIINMPYEIAHQKQNHRYTIVFDYNFCDSLK